MTLLIYAAVGEHAVTDEGDQDGRLAFGWGEAR